MQGRRSLNLPLEGPLFEERRANLQPFEEEEENEIPMANENENIQNNLNPHENVANGVPANGQVQEREEDIVERREMRELARPVVTSSNSCLVLSDAARNYELKGIYYNMLPSFHGLANEDPLTFIRTFYDTLEHFPLHALTEDQLRMRCFPQTLKERAKTWWISLPAASLRTWEEVYHKFMRRYYSYQKTTNLRQQISTFQQQEGEPFHEAWERYKQLLLECPHHYYAPELLNQFFYDGLTLNSQCIVDNAAGGTMGNKTSDEIHEIFEMLGANSQQKSIRSGRRGNVNMIKASNDKDEEIARLEKEVQRLNMRESVKQCQVCGEHGHTALNCYGEETNHEQVNMMNIGYQKGRNDAFTNTYNPGWRNHPNFSWKNNNVQQPEPPQQSAQPYRPPQQRTQYNYGGQQQYQQSRAQEGILEEKVNTLIDSVEKTRVDQDRKLDNLTSTVRKLEIQIGQVAEQIPTQRHGKLPSQPETSKAV